MEIISYFLVFILVCWIVLSVYLSLNTSKIARLGDQPLSPIEPPLAVVIAVRDEEDHLKEALMSVFKLNYSSLRIIVVDDRSTDRTAEILDEMSILHPQLTIIQVTSLPPLWLGKTHALYAGYQEVTEDWILFTDADVVFDPNALGRAMSYVLAHQLDHLTILPEVQSRSTVLNGILATFQVMLEINLRPWLAKNPKSSASIGVGAFNLIRKSAYEAIGTHVSIKLRPDDDLRLGKAIKSAGFKQDVLYGEGQVSLEWYHDVGQFIDGLMKNTYSAFDYQTLTAIGAALAALLVFALPIPLGLIHGTATSVRVAIGIMVIQVVFYAYKGGKQSRWWYGLLVSYAGLLMAYITLKATFMTLKNKGIYWRGTFYALDVLKDNRKS